MKALLVGVFLLASPLRAQPGGNCSVADCPWNFMPVPVPPSIAAKKKVEKALVAIKTAEINEKASAEKLADRLNFIRFELEEENNKRFFRRTIKAEDVAAAALLDQEYVFRQENLRTATNATYMAHNAAIREAMSAYHLLPPVTDFTGDPRAAEVNMVDQPWLPHYSRREIRDKNTGQWRKRDAEDLAQERLENAVVGGGVMAARTRGNGVMEFYGQAFSSPEELAINLYHETSHWVDIAGRSGGFKVGNPPEVSFRTEQHAYERAAAFAKQIGANPQRHQDLANQFKLQAKITEDEHLTKAQILTDPRFQLWIGKRWEGSLAMAPAEPDISPGDEALLQKMMAAAQANARSRAGEQLKIAHRDHDERLKNTLIDLVQRSCANPGSITQSELDSLPTPFRENFFYVNPATGELPEGLGNCAALYISLGKGARLDAEEVRRQSAAISPDQVARQPVPVVAVPAATQPPPPFSTVLASLKEFSVTACREPERVELDSFLFRLYDHSYRNYDDNLAKDLAINLDQCSRRLFFQMIGIIRAREPRQLSAIDRQWIRTTVAAFLKVPDSSPGYAPPSSGGGGGRRCEEYGNIRCP